MRITSVEYRRLRSFGNYEHEVVGATAEISDGYHESPDEALEGLRAWVEAQLSIREEAANFEDQRHRAQIRLREVTDLLRESEKRWKAAQKILAAAGVEVPNDYSAEGEDGLANLPF